MRPLDRRAFLRAALGVAGALGAAGAGLACGSEATPPPDDGWDAGPLAHLLATASHDRILIKASFVRPFPDPPILAAGARRAEGERTDSRGHFFRFDVSGLAPGTVHTLRLHAGSGGPLCEAWPLATFPAPDAQPARFRLLAYTCAGGPDRLFGLGLVDAYVRIAHRQRLLARALSFAPDAVIANGDHVYWDLRSRFGRLMGRSPHAWLAAGHFDRNAPIAGTGNEDVLVRAFGPQIAGLYGVRLRSVPVFFLQDDHDYGENDEASDALRTFPPDPFMRDLARTTQRLYYPELIADAALPATHVGSGGVGESFGALRYGGLFEGLLYDCRRYLSNDAGRFLPPEIERWLAERSAASRSLHLVHFPGAPVLWSAGKWAEWYPDVRGEQGVLRADSDKPWWEPGWGAQHDRLLAAAAARPDRTPLFVCGDLHATAAGRILATHGRSLAANPPVAVLSGALGTGSFGWPSTMRGTVPVPSATLDTETWVRPLEENGFSLLDFDAAGTTLRLFRWLPERGEAALAALAPFETLELPRPGR